MKLLDTRSEHFLRILTEGTVSTNVYLRRMHNFAMDMAWVRETVSCMTLVTFVFWLWMAANGLNCEESKFMENPLGVFRSIGLNNCDPQFSNAIAPLTVWFRLEVSCSTD